jgi:hypothetical protein
VRSRRGSRRRGFSLGQAVRIAFLAVVAIFLGWWAVRAAAVSAFGRDNPFAAAAVAPGDPRTALRLAMAEFQARNGRIQPETERRALAALDSSTLADEPFLLSAVSAAAAHDDRRAEALLTESRRRNPRSRFTRLLLLDMYLRHGRSEQAGEELAALSRLIPEASGALVPELSRLARDPKTRPGLARMLRQNPGIRDATLANLAARDGDADLVIALAAEAGSGGDPAHPPEWQGVLLDKLINAGQIDRAYRLWQSAAHVSGDPATKGLYDAAFAGAPGGPPFNWQLTSDSEGVAERGRSGLQIDYYGRAPRTLARQLLILKPGTYRLQMKGEGAAKGDGTRLSWSVTCVEAKAPLVQLPLTDIGSAPRTLAASFTVPTGCRAEWLRLDGAPGDVSAEQAATISNLQIAPAGGR